MQLNEINSTHCQVCGCTRNANISSQTQPSTIQLQAQTSSQQASYSIPLHNKTQQKMSPNTPATLAPIKPRLYLYMLMLINIG